MNETYLYPYSAQEARIRNQLPMWRESYRANVACRNAIEETIRQNFDGMHLKKDCLEPVLAEYGYKRTEWVLATTLQELSWDGRFSSTKPVCANVDLFSGLIYNMLGISEDIYTPLFAIARVPGWCAHRVEEVVFANRIIRPAYKYLGVRQKYKPIEER